MKREQCPKCASIGKDRSQDNLAVYPDGSKYCFSCGYFVTSSNIEFKKPLKANDKFFMAGIKRAKRSFIM